MNRRSERGTDDFIRVRFNVGGKTYTYYCLGAKPGDMVRLPPADVGGEEQFAVVEALGREYWKGPIKEAELVVRFGPRSYTAEQADFIAETVRDRRELPGTPLSIEASR